MVGRYCGQVHERWSQKSPINARGVNHPRTGVRRLPTEPCLDGLERGVAQGKVVRRAGGGGNVGIEGRDVELFVVRPVLGVFLARVAMKSIRVADGRVRVGKDDGAALGPEVETVAHGLADEGSLREFPELCGVIEPGRERALAGDHKEMAAAIDRLVVAQAL